MNKTLITSYQSQDLDGFACIVAYAELLGFTPGILGVIDSETRYVLEKYNIKELEDVVLKDFDQIILVDVSDPEGINKNIDIDRVVEIIDHRKANRADVFVNAKKQIELVGAAATLIAEKFKEQGKDISKESALLLYGAIISNTLNFQSNTFTPRDVEMAEWLKTKVEIEDDFIHEMFLAKSKVEDLNYTAEFDFNGKKMGISQLEVVGAKKMVLDKQDWIINKLKEFKQENKLDLIFLTIIDLEKGFNLFVTEDKEMQQILEKIFTVEFNGFIVEKAGVIMRKEIVPLLKEELEKI